MKYFLSFLFIAYSVAFAQDDPSKNKQPKTFSLNPNDLGALENSVNLFTGQVAFSMNLATLPGRGGLNVSVNIQYNSNVDQYIGKRNLEAPTGIVGLGWSLDVPKIVVNNKLTGSRSDDEFYLVEGGQSKKLVCTSSTNYPRTYEVKSPDLWKIQYYHYDEKWVVTRENGFKYVFGDDESNRNTVQWVVRWGNWIGNSVMSTGQEQQVHTWNISEVENLWGDKLRFEYEVVEEFVAKDLALITSHKKHTKASYLKRISGPAGYSVAFLYGEKLYESGSGKREYQDSHPEKAEPDAYQEKYESRYLDRLIVRNHDGSVLYETDLAYDTDLIGSGEEVKRLLTSIKNIYPSGKSMPPVRFEYFDSGDFIGSLKKVTNSYGAYYEYNYERSEIPFSDLDITIDAPTPGQWKEHYVYPGNDYAIVVWRTVNADGSHNPDFRPCKIWLYYWDGRWNKKDLTQSTPYGHINVKTRENDEGERVLDWQITLGEYFFAYLYPESGSSNQSMKIWYRRESANPAWQLQSLSAGSQAVLLSGDHFVATYAISDPIISTCVFDGDGMRFLDIDASDEAHEYFASAANNYIFVHNDNGGYQDNIHVFHLSEDKKWVKTSAPASQLFDTDGEGFRISYWHSFNSFTMGLPWDNEEFIYMWDTNFGNIRRSQGWGRRPDNSYVYSRGNSMLSILPREPSFAPEGGNNSRSARYNGSSWQFTPLYRTATPSHFSPGGDFILRNLWLPYKLEDVVFQEYDPNIPGWKNEVQFTQAGTYLNMKDSFEGLAIEAGMDAFVIDDGDYYQRDLEGNWGYKTNLKLGTGEYLVGKSVILTPTLIAYEYSFGKEAEPFGSYISFIKNGEIDKTVRYFGQTLDSKPHNHVGNNLVVHVANPTTLILRKIIDGRAEGPLYTRHVSVLHWYDGNKTFHNAYDYDLTAAKSDPSGTLAYFNKVTVVPGTANLGARPFGQTDYYFFNGLHSDSLVVMPLNRFTNAYAVGVGEMYQTDVVNSTQDTVSFSKTEFETLTKNIRNADGETVDVDLYLRPKKMQQMVDSVFTETINAFYPETGLLEYTTTKNSSHYAYRPTTNAWRETADRYQRYFTYWWEVYDQQKTSDAWIHDVVQVTDTYTSPAGTDTLSSSVTRWRSWPGGKRAPDMVYGWLRNSDASFPAWNYPAAPPSANWKLGNEITLRDALTGLVLESRNASGIPESVLYDETRTKALANVTNARHAQIAFTSFEPNGKGNWIYNDGASVQYDSALTGQTVFRDTLGNVTSQDLEPGSYIVSFWAKDGSPQVSVTNGVVTSSNTYAPRVGWVLHRTIFQVNVSPGNVKVSLNGAMIDELRLHPSGASMVSYTYNSRGGVVAQVSSNYLITYYSYDDMDRLYLVKDHDKNIIKRYDYRYRDEEEYLSALMAYAKQDLSDTIAFSVSHPVYDVDTAAYYQWDFGDGHQSEGTDSIVNHLYASPGIYQAKVTVTCPGNEDVLVADEKAVYVPEDLVVVARISSGWNQIVSCPQQPNTAQTSFSATIISSECQDFSYKWFYTLNGYPHEFGTGSTASYIFTLTGDYEIYCQISNSCGQAVESNHVTLSVTAPEEYCSN